MGLLLVMGYLLIGWLMWLFVKNEFDPKGGWQQDTVLFTCLFFWPIVLFGVLIAGIYSLFWGDDE